MAQDPVQRIPLVTRRRLLQGVTSGAAGLLAWHQSWPHLPHALAQKSAPSGQMTWAIHVNIAPTWFDPAETPGIITPYMFLYAMHDALVKPMPDKAMSPCLATQWSESADGLSYDFELRQGVKFHNGDPFTAEDVKFSFERYKGSGAQELKKKVKALEIIKPHQVRFQLHEPWPDFLTFYASPATGAGWIVPKNYTEKIGNEKFKEQPVGLGPYRFANYQPGVELVLEANTEYWRKTPQVQRLIMKSVPEATTRLAMLKKQEADVTYGLYGALGEEVRRDPTLKLEPVVLPGTQWVVFAEHYHNPKSPWADKRVRQAANHAINRQSINDAETLGYSVLSGSIIPRKFDYALSLEPYAYDPNKARQLLKEAGYANGFDAGECGVDNVYTGVIEAMVNDLTAVGIRAKVRPMERAAHQAGLREKTFKHLAFQGSGAFGNAATRLDAFATTKGAQSWIKDAEIDAWYEQQAVERDRQKRQTLLHKIQQKLYDEALVIPLWELGFLCASGPRAAVSGLSLIPLFAYSG
ncbi:MAG: ABC transporter substrate-binding protein, partial [Candidatus Tectomicrobia bacterium]|nr:ABC transporter substrate-binding protein [Candidatus Tectomicrobia bacterium]